MSLFAMLFVLLIIALCVWVISAIYAIGIQLAARLAGSEYIDDCNKTLYTLLKAYAVLFAISYVLVMLNIKNSLFFWLHKYRGIFLGFIALSESF